MGKINIGILGMGTVATGLINILQFNETKITDDIEKKITVKKVLVKNIDKKRDNYLNQDIYTSNVDEIINDSDIQIVVELIGGLTPAYEYIKKALNNKKNVVTANKALMATHGEELERIADDNGVRLMFEASVGGGIPIINTMSNNLGANQIEGIAGIINGTTNYILTQMTQRGLEYNEAVLEAQEAGFAEADPSSDLGGDDAAFKLAILATIAFGQRINVKSIAKEGITKISREDICYATELGYNIKLLATAQKREDELELRVHPALIPSGHPLTTVKNEYNAVYLKGNAVGEIMLYGKGAGALPTGSAVLGDIINIIKDMELSKSQKKIIGKKFLKIANKGLSQYYIRLEVIDKPGVLGNIANIFGANNISIASVVQRQKNGNTAPLVFITHDVERKYVDSALETIKNYENVTKIESIIMVEKL